MNYNPSSGLYLESERCEDGYERLGAQCLPIICESGYKLVNSSCLEIPRIQISVDVDIAITFSDEQGSSLFIVHVNNGSVMEEYKEDLHLVLKHFHVNKTVQSLSLDIVNQSKTDEYFYMQYTVHYNLTSNFLLDANSTEPPTANINSLMFNRLMIYMQSHNLDVSSITVISGVVRQEFVSHTNKTVCTRVRFTPSLFILTNDTLQILETGQLISLKHVTFQNSSALVCKDVLELSGEPDFGTSSALGLTTIVVMSISLVCLFARLMLQPLLKVYGTQPMKLQFCLCLTLFLAFLLFLIGPLLNGNMLPCHIVGIFIHWAFLSAFFWKMVMQWTCGYTFDLLEDL
jgi:hypothetical protein